jgi:hypothetical protein
VIAQLRALLANAPWFDAVPRQLSGHPGELRRTVQRYSLAPRAPHGLKSFGAADSGCGIRDGLQLRIKDGPRTAGFEDHG